MLAAAPLLFAQGGSFIDMGRKFRHGGGGLSPGEILSLVLLVVAVLLAGWILSRFLNAEDRPGFNNPRRMFRELCRAHHLDRRSRRLLRRLAKHHQLASPAQLFLEPERFDMRLLSAPLQQYSAQIEHLRDGLFGRRVGEQ